MGQYDENFQQLTPAGEFLGAATDLI